MERWWPGCPSGARSPRGPGIVALFQARELPWNPPAKLLRMGPLTNLLNPKAAIMYLALIPQFFTSQLRPIS